MVRYEKNDAPLSLVSASAAGRFPRKRSGLKSSASSPWTKPRVTYKHTLDIGLTHIGSTITIDRPANTNVSFDQNRSFNGGTLYHTLATQVVPLGMKNPSYQSSYKCKCRKPETSHYQVDLPVLYSAALLVRHHIFRNIPLRTLLTERANGSPPESFSKSSTEVGKTIRICESRHPRAAYDSV